MLRALFTASSAASLLLCGALALLWARSARTADSVQIGKGNPGYQIPLGKHVSLGSVRGVFTVTYFRDWVIQPPVSIPLTTWWYDYEATPLLTQKGVQWWRDAFRFRNRTGQRRQVIYTLGNGRVGSWTFGVAVPHWFLVLIFSVPPAARWVLPWSRRRRRRWRQRCGLCLRCGYDLRASGGRCPECGARRDAGAAGPSPEGEAGAASPVA